MPPLWTQKSHNLSGQKNNHATFRDKKKPRNILEQFFLLPLGTKKKLHILLGQKNHVNCSKLLQMLQNDFGIVPNGPKWSQRV